MYRHGCVSVFCWLCEVALYISQPSITISNTQDLNGQGDLRSVGAVALGLWGNPSRTPPKKELSISLTLKPCYLQIVPGWHSTLSTWTFEKQLRSRHLHTDTSFVHTRSFTEVPALSWPESSVRSLNRGCHNILLPAQSV